jgi:hypothetical protein
MAREPGSDKGFGVEGSDVLEVGNEQITLHLGNPIEGTGRTAPAAPFRTVAVATAPNASPPGTQYPLVVAPPPVLAALRGSPPPQPRLRSEGPPFRHAYASKSGPSWRRSVASSLRLSTGPAPPR